MDGFLNLFKPAGFTSHDCVAKVRRSLKLKRVGHAGTLDPAATGVLPIAVGRATRLLQFLPGEKRYRAAIRLGITTTTDDLEGEILSQYAVPNLDQATVEAMLQQFQGTFQQLPPNYSAVQVGGKRLYDLARDGKEITVQARTVEVYGITVLAWRPGDFPELEIDISCGAGTYIRAIARDLGSSLQTGGTLAALQRTESSGFLLAESFTFEDLEVALQRQNLSLVSPEAALRSLAQISLPDAIARRWCFGQRIAWSDLQEATATPPHILERFPHDDRPISGLPALRIHHEMGNFLGIGRQELRQDGWVLAPAVVYAPL